MMFAFTFSPLYNGFLHFSKPYKLAIVPNSITKYVIHMVIKQRF